MKCYTCAGSGTVKTPVCPICWSKADTFVGTNFFGDKQYHIACENKAGHIISVSAVTQEEAERKWQLLSTKPTESTATTSTRKRTKSSPS